MLEIKCGNPEDGPASFTRFALPFAYKPRRRTQQPKPPHFFGQEKNCSSENRIWRERYLTDETSYVLFKSARWLSFQASNGGPVETSFPMVSSEKDVLGNVWEKMINVEAAPPTLVLFEWENRKDNNENSEDLLHIGFLIQTLYLQQNQEESVTIEDLLKLNELYRYWQQPFDKHECNGYKATLQYMSWKPGIKDKQLGDMNDPAELYFDRWAEWLKMPIQDEIDKNMFWDLFPLDLDDNWAEKARAKISKKASTFMAGGSALDENPSKHETTGDNTNGWIVYADNRTFVWTCVLLNDGGNELRRVFLRPGIGKPSDFGHWIKLLNADLPGSDVWNTHKSTEFERQWAAERTYHRWEHLGTFYGFSYHCGAMLGSPCPEPPLWLHFGALYFDQVLLLLYLRVALFRFSMRLSEISALVRKSDIDGNLEKWQENFRMLRRDFALFTNLYQFPLLSNQQQAVEMYSLARKQMDVDSLFEEIEKEIQSSHDYISAVQDQQQAVRMERLTVVATVGLIVALSFGFWSMSIVGKQITEHDWFKKIDEWYLLAGTAITISLLFGGVIKYSGKLASIIRWLSDWGSRRK